MKFKQIKNYNYILALLFFSFGFSQDYEGKLDKVENGGLHKLHLTSNINNASNNNINHIRIYDEQGNEIPYIILNNINYNKSSLENLEILSENNIKDSITSIIVENKLPKSLTKISLFISNTEINKSYNISGSNDKETWFGLVSNQFLDNIFSKNKSTVEKVIQFPINDYKFLKIDFNNKGSLPININKVGYYQTSNINAKLEKIRNFNYEIINHKQTKETYIKFSSNLKQNINSIAFDINSKMYLRNVKLRKKNK